MLMCTLKKKWNSYNRVCKKILYNRDDRMSINCCLLFSCRVVLVFSHLLLLFSGHPITVSLKSVKSGIHILHVTIG